MMPVWPILRRRVGVWARRAGAAAAPSPSVTALVKSRRVIWICPEEEPSWALGDSEMPLYVRSVDRVVVVRTLSDLETAAERIVPV